MIKRFNDFYKINEINTPIVPSGDKYVKRGIGGRIPNDQKIRMNSSSDLIDNISSLEDNLKQLKISERMKYLNMIEKSLNRDARKSKGYQEYTESQRDKMFLIIKRLKKEYVGKTSIKEKGVTITIDENGVAFINGNKIFIDEDSGYVKLGSVGRGSSSGALYGGGHFDGQLQGNKYVHQTVGLINRMVDGNNISQSIKSLKEFYPDGELNPTLQHLGLMEFND